MRVADSGCQVYWKNIRRRAGWVLRVGRNVQFDLYFDFGNDTKKSPNRQQPVGLALQIHFSVK